jgi:two-component system, cell cycle sensor histidine kinase and response regulator CckA
MMDSGPTVLVVDDDPQIPRLVEQMLGARRVEVVVASGAAAALRICELRPIDLLISDIVMPVMDGNKLAGRVLKLQPQVSVLLISGSHHDSARTRFPRVRFLRKPFFPSDLLRIIRELLPGI